MKLNNFWKGMLSDDESHSSKRLVTLVISLHFILASFATLFFAFFVLVYMPKGRIEPELFNLLKDILEYDFYIILAGLGFISGENMVKMYTDKAKGVITPPPPPPPPPDEEKIS